MLNQLKIWVQSPPRSRASPLRGFWPVRATRLHATSEFQLFDDLVEIIPSSRLML